MDIDQLRDRLEYFAERTSVLEKQLACIQRIASALGSRRQLDDVLHTIAEQVTAMLDAERATVFLVEEDSTDLVAKVIIGGGLTNLRLKQGQGIAGWVAQTGRTLNVKDAYKDQRFDPAFDTLSGFKTRSILCQPMVTYQGRTVGVIQVLNKLNGYFSVADEHLLAVITTQATIFIENSKYFTQLREANLRLQEAQENLKKNFDRLETVYRIQRGMGQQWEKEGLLKGVLDELMPAIPCEMVAALTLQGGVGRLLVRERGDGNTRTIFPAPLEGILAESVMDGRFHPPSGSLEARSLHPMLDVELRTLLLEPLVGTNGEVFGVIGLVNRADLLDFDAEDAQIVRIVAGHIGEAFARLEQHEELTRANNLALIGSALSGVLHDLKSPMSIISGYVQLMETEDDPEKRSEYAELILKQFKHISTMTQEVLSFARGETQIFKRTLYPARFLAEMEELLRQELSGRNITLEVQDSMRNKFKADEGKLKRLFFNIARNAREAMPDGGKFVIRAEETDDAVIFTFSDTGVGIPEEIRDRLFQSFVTQGKKDGTGLGLAIVKSIVEQHGGEISFDTQTGKGTTFTITLPKE